MFVYYLVAVFQFFLLPLGYAETTHSESLDNLLLENIEALAAGETGSGGACVGRGSVVCPLTKEGVEHVHIYYSMPH